MDTWVAKLAAPFSSINGSTMATVIGRAASMGPLSVAWGRALAASLATVTGPLANAAVGNSAAVRTASFSASFRLAKRLCEMLFMMVSLVMGTLIQPRDPYAKGNDARRALTGNPPCRVFTRTETI